MRNQGRNNRRSRSHKDNGDDSQLNIPRDDPPVQAYSRHQHSSHYNDSQRLPSSMSNRSTYDTGRDRHGGVGGRGMREDDWSAPSGQDRYGYDLYHHGDHDGYGDTSRRDADTWGSSNETTYSSRGGWSHSYHHPEASTSYQEPASWNAPSPTGHHYNVSPRYKPPVDQYHSPNHYSSRTPNHYPERSPLAYDDTQGYYYDNWRGRDPRPATPPEERVDYAQMDKRNNQGWKKDNTNNRGSKVAAPKFQSDSGWSGRKKGKEWIEPSQTQAHWDDKPAESSYAYEDRSWEPAESWKSSNRGESSGKSQQQQHSSNGRQSGSQQQKSSSKRTKNSNKSKKEWKADDSGLNNWTRRDTSTSKKQDKQSSSSSRKKHRRTPSRSRSPESVRSHRSSYRSRSSSPVAKRRRRDSSPMLRSRSPVERIRSSRKAAPEDDRMRSRSPSPYKSPVSHRRRSPSTSDRSSIRSRSPSPYERRRQVHRLPTANTPSVQPSPAGGTSGKSKKSKQKNGQKRQSGGKQQHQPQQQQHHSRYADQDRERDVDSISMPPPPPPTLIPPIRPNRASRQQTPDTRDDYPLPNGLPPKPLSLPEKPRMVPIIKAAFKPIAQPNSALRMFFPSEEEEADHSSNHAKAPQVEPVPATKRVLHPFHPAHIPTLPERPLPFQPPSHIPVHQPETWDPYHAPPPPPPPDPRAVAHAYDFRRDAKNGITPVTESIVSQLHTGTTPQWSPAGAMPSDMMTARDTRSTPKPSPIPMPSTAPSPSSAWDPTPLPAGAMSVASAPAVAEPNHKDLYAILNQVGEGTFGKVYKARNTISNVYVALKRIRMETERDGFPVTAMREIKLLQSLKHPNVVQLYEMMVSNGSVYMVFEYMDHDLTGILSQTQFKFTDAHLKSLCHQMLAGLGYLHHKGVIHRDIKGSNILLNNRGELKLADFGLARFYQKRRRADYTNRVITLWYRPPELLFGTTIYGAEVDMWSAGCIMLELYTKRPVFQGNDEIHQLHAIFKILGTPTVSQWPGLAKLPWYELIKPKESLPNKLRETFAKWMSPAALDLAEGLLTYDPELRMTAQDALDASYFTQEQPPAERPSLSSIDGEWHELETKLERGKKRKKNEAPAA